MSCTQWRSQEFWLGVYIFVQSETHQHPLAPTLEPRGYHQHQYTSTPLESTVHCARLPSAPPCPVLGGLGPLATPLRVHCSNVTNAVIVSIFNISWETKAIRCMFQNNSCFCKQFMRRPYNKHKQCNGLVSNKHAVRTCTVGLIDGRH